MGWKERIAPKVKRVIGPAQPSRAERARQPVCLCCVQKPAAEPEAALRRLTFVYQTMRAHSSLRIALHSLPLWQIATVMGMLMGKLSGQKCHQHVQRLRHTFLKAANWLVLLAVSLIFQRFWYHFPARHKMCKGYRSSCLIYDDLYPSLTPVMTCYIGNHLDCFSC